MFARQFKTILAVIFIQIIITAATEKACSEECGDFHRNCPALTDPTYLEKFEDVKGSGQFEDEPISCNNSVYKMLCPQSCGLCTLCSKGQLNNQSSLLSNLSSQFSDHSNQLNDLISQVYAQSSQLKELETEMDALNHEIQYSWDKTEMYIVSNNSTYLIKDDRKCIKGSDGSTVARELCGGGKYALVYKKSTTLATWEEAQQACKEEGGRLFDDVYASKDEIKDMCAYSALDTVHNDGWSWTQIWSPGNSHVWKNDLTNEQYSNQDIKNWGSNQPNFSTSNGRWLVYACKNSHAGMLYDSVKGTWKYNYVCIL